MTFRLSDWLREVADHLDLPPKRDLARKLVELRASYDKLETTSLQRYNEILRLGTELIKRPTMEHLLQVREQMDDETKTKIKHLERYAKNGGETIRTLRGALAELTHAVETDPSSSGTLVEKARNLKRLT